MDYFQFLPVEIKLEILTRVPAESVPDCKSVCTNWLSVVGHPWFSKMHTHRHLDHPDNCGTLGFIACTRDDNHVLKFHYFEYNENHDESTTPVQRMTRVNLTTSVDSSFRGSSNGLICLEDGKYDVCICNPITRESVVLPKPKETYVGGFGYVSSTGEYKVLGIRCERKFARVYVYTLGSGKGWRNLGKFKSQLSTLSGRNGPGTFANGAVYWLDSKLQFILTFDLAEEKFCENLSLPVQPKHYYHDIGVLNGALYFLIGIVLKGEVDRLFDVWLLKKKIDNHDMELRDERQSLGWSKEFRVDRYDLLAITKSGTGVLDGDVFHFRICDTKTSTSKTLVGFRNYVCEIYPHKNTLVSLKELGEEDTKTMVSVEVEETSSPHEFIFL